MCAIHLPPGLRVQLHATLPVFIFISPLLSFDDNNNIIGDPNALPTVSELNVPPPLYGAHQFDRLYSDVDLSGYMTPARSRGGHMTPTGRRSGFSTPFFSHSRSTSSDNVAATTLSEFAATALQNSLHGLGNLFNLRDRNQASSTPNLRPAGGAFGTSGGSPSQYNPRNLATRRASQDETTGTPTDFSPQHMEFSAEALARVPSYNTARRSRPIAPVHHGLPNYQSAIRAPVVPAVMPQPPNEDPQRISHQDPQRTSHQDPAAQQGPGGL